MNEPRNDDERLAALLDGRLRGPERDALLGHLARAGEDYDVFADTAAVLREAEARGEVPPEEREEAGVIPLRSRPGPRPLPRWAALAAAAVVAGLLLAAPLLRAPRGSDPVRVAARLEHADRGLPAGWTERAPFPATRGAAAPRARRGEAVRAGVLLVDLAVAVEGGDAAQARLLAQQGAARFDPQGGREGPLAQLAVRAGEPPEALRPLVGRAAERLGERWGRDALEAGAWTEAARLAAHHGDAAFFRSGVPRGVERLATDDPDARAAAAELRALLARPGAPPFRDVSAALERLLAALAAQPAPPPT